MHSMFSCCCFPISHNVFFKEKKHTVLFKAMSTLVMVQCGLLLNYFKTLLPVRQEKQFVNVQKHSAFVSIIKALR